MPNEGFWVIHEGNAEGNILGANLCTFNLLQGTTFMPSLKNAILFLEEDALAGEFTPVCFDRDLQSLIHLPNFTEVKGLLIGRFQIQSNMTRELLQKIINSKKELAHIPVIANLDFGHTDPMITFPIGGNILVSATQSNIKITVLSH